MKWIFFILGMLLLMGVEILRVYFIMPFPGSQEDDTLAIAYFLHGNIFYFRLLGIAMTAYPAYQLVKSSNTWVRWPVIVVLSFWLLIVYAFNFRFLADRMFYPVKTKRMAAMTENKVPTNQLVLGVSVKDESRAYPIEVIGYHHQVRDTLAGEPIMVTYCTVCRSGRVFSPRVQGQLEQFRLVGMDHYNAMFEDSRTKSWWRQVNGEAVAGPLKGQSLAELPSQQMTLEAWAGLYPDTKVLQPDSAFIQAYEGLADYDEGKMKGRLEGKDSVSWGEKSWVIGIQVGNEARAYDWIALLQTRVANDVVGGTPLLVVIEPDSASFHVFHREVKGEVLNFQQSADGQYLLDQQTGSKWSWRGACIEGPLASHQMTRLQSYQEYWHSWRTFHPNSTRYSRPR
jgi:hypothetical protein